MRQAKSMLHVDIQHFTLPPSLKVQLKLRGIVIENYIISVLDVSCQEL